MFVAAASRKQPDPWRLASLTFLRLPSKLAMAHMKRLRERFENNSRSHLKTFVPPAAFAISSLWNRYAWIDQCSSNSTHHDSRRMIAYL